MIFIKRGQASWPVPSSFTMLTAISGLWGLAPIFLSPCGLVISILETTLLAHKAIFKTNRYETPS